MNKLKKMKELAEKLIITMTLILNLNVVNVYAASTSSITAPLNNLKTLLLAIVGAVGGVFLVKGVYEFAVAYQQGDNAGMSAALKGLISGIMMVGVSTVLAIMGI